MGAQAGFMAATKVQAATSGETCRHWVNHTVVLVSRDNNLNIYHSAEDWIQLYLVREVPNQCLAECPGCAFVIM